MNVRRLVLGPLLCVIGFASAAGAEWIVFTSGAAMQVVRIEPRGDRVRLTRRDGGWVTAPVDRIDWPASSIRSGHDLGPGQLVESAGNGDDADAPFPRTAAGTPMPSANTDEYRAFALRVSTPPTVDGRLDDDAWQRALPFGGLYQEERHEGEPASEHTEVRVVYDDENVYFGIRNFDRDPQAIMAKNMLRESTLRTDDSIRILLDPLHDHRTAYLIGTNPNGMLVDSYLFGRTEARMNRDWTGIWWTRGSIDEQGWSTEVVIPLKTLKFRKGDVQVWGLTISRRIARRNEFSYWPFIPNSSTFYWAGSCGHLEGISDVDPGRDLQFKPYVAGGLQKSYASAQTARQSDIGFDFKYGFTPNLAADFTYNTDFAQTEVDDVQVNLTRFPLYYQEKRQYFLEGARIFDFGIKQQAEIFYSRRIGLTESGTQVPVIAGGRLNGKQGKYYVGALNIQTGEARANGSSGGAPLTNWTAARVSRDIGDRSQIGMVFTSRIPSGELFTNNQVVGVDGTFYRGDRVNVDGFVAAVFDPSIKDRRLAGRGAFTYETDTFGAVASYLDVQDNFRPGMGFMSRVGIRRSTVSARYSPRPRVWGLRRVFVEPSIDYFATQEDVPESRERKLSLKSEFDSGDTVSLHITENLENLFGPFAIRSGVIIPAGTYVFTDATLGLQSFPGRALSGQVSATAGNFYGGQRFSTAVGASWRFNKYFNLTPSYALDHVDLPGNRFTTHVIRNRFNVNFSALISLSGLVQWSNANRDLIANVRVNWVYRPGMDFYLVYTEVDNTFRSLTPKDRTLIAKVNYILHF